MAGERPFDFHGTPAAMCTRSHTHTTNCYPVAHTVRCGRCGDTGPWTATHVKEPHPAVFVCPLCVNLIVAEWYVKKQEVDLTKTS